MKLATGRLVNGLSCGGSDMVIKDLDLEPKIDAMMRSQNLVTYYVKDTQWVIAIVESMLLHRAGVAKISGAGVAVGGGIGRAGAWANALRTNSFSSMSNYIDILNKYSKVVDSHLLIKFRGNLKSIGFELGFGSMGAGRSLVRSGGVRKNVSWL
ncbi:hypothetical protein Tco_0012970 [Tanacetum coccineum]